MFSLASFVLVAVLSQSFFNVGNLKYNTLTSFSFTEVFYSFRCS